MGSGSWSSNAYDFYYVNNDLKSRSINEVFNNNDISVSNTINSLNKSARLYNNNISVHQENVGVRECRDSEEHPNTTPIIVAFDVTGSMGIVPNMMVRDLLPKLMIQLEEAKIPDPELLFIAFGDHHTDRCPIQVTQFESDTEKICNALTDLYLEGAGGGNSHESALMAWIVAGYHTETDSWYKRHKKGYLFTISDEGCHPDISAEALIKFMSYERGCKRITAVEALDKAKEQYNVFHLHVNGHHRYVSSWDELLSDHITKCNAEDINNVIVDIIKKNESTEEPSGDFKY